MSLLGLQHLTVLPNAMEEPSWLLLKPSACSLQTPPRQESKAVEFSSGTIYLKNFEGRTWVMKMRTVTVRNKCECPWHNSFKNTALLVDSRQASSFSLAQLNFFVLSFHMGAWYTIRRISTIRYQLEEYLFLNSELKFQWESVSGSNCAEQFLSEFLGISHPYCSFLQRSFMVFDLCG